VALQQHLVALQQHLEARVSPHDKVEAPALGEVVRAVTAPIRIVVNQLLPLPTPLPMPAPGSEAVLKSMYDVGFGQDPDLQPTRLRPR